MTWKRQAIALLLQGAVLGCNPSSAVDGETETDANATDTDPSDLPDPMCLPDWDVSSPSLRVRALMPSAPPPLALMGSGSQTVIGDDEPTPLLTLSGQDGATHISGFFGTGIAADSEETYRFTEDPTPVSFVLDKNKLSSIEPFDFTLTATLASGDVITVPLQEVSIQGIFTTEQRCSIGKEVPQDPFPVWHPGGSITGLLSVDDARSITVTYQTLTFSLCAYLAYGLTEGLHDDPYGEMDQSEWEYPPNATLTSGELAWRTAAHIAATAIHLAGSVPSEH